jgi:hypothetical protein
MVSDEEIGRPSLTPESHHISDWNHWVGCDTSVTKKDLINAGKEGFGSFCRKLNKWDPRSLARFFAYESITTAMFTFSEFTRYAKPFKFLPPLFSEPLRKEMTLPLEHVWTTWGPTAAAPTPMYELLVKPFLLKPLGALEEKAGEVLQKVPGSPAAQKIEQVFPKLAAYLFPKIADFSLDLKTTDYGTDQFLSLTVPQLKTATLVIGFIFAGMEFLHGDMPDTAAAAIGSLTHLKAGQAFIKRLQPGRIREIEHNVGVILSEEAIGGKLHQSIEGLLQSQGEEQQKEAKTTFVQAYQETLKAAREEVNEGTKDIAGLVRKNPEARDHLNNFNLALSALLIHRHSLAILATIGELGEKDLEKVGALREYFKERLEKLQSRQERSLEKYRQDL